MDHAVENHLLKTKGNDLNRDLSSFIIYLQSECIEKYQFELCSKYDREYGVDVILG